MGLQQNRIIKEYQDSVFAVWKKEFDEVSGEIPMEVLWETMQSDDNDCKEDYFQWYDAGYFRPLTSVFKDLCSDTMGKDAVRAGVNKIIIDGSDETSTLNSVSFSNGVLTLKHIVGAYVQSEEELAERWKKMIEAKL